MLLLLQLLLPPFGFDEADPKIKHTTTLGIVFVDFASFFYFWL